MKIPAVSLAALVLTLGPSEGWAQTAHPLNAMLDRVGGASAPTWSDDQDPVLWPMREAAPRIAGARFLEEKLRSNGTATAERARTLFAEQCTTEGGRVEAQNSLAMQAYDKWAVGKRLPNTAGFKHRWVGLTSLCTAGPDRVLAGFYAAVFDPTGVATDGDAGSKLMMRLFTQKTKTAIYLIRADGISTPASMNRVEAQRVELRQARIAAEDASIAKLRAEVAVGTETNCGTVIQLRRPMVEIAVPATVRTPNGQATFWSKIDRLLPPSVAPCTFGL